MSQKKPPLNSDTHSALMGDLESIRTLLDSDDENGGDDTHDEVPADDDGGDIPVLEDVVDATSSSSALPDTATNDRWRVASDAFIAQAKALIRAKGLGDHLSDAQRALIDALVDTLRAALDQELDHLRTEFHSRLEKELDHIKSELFGGGD